MTTPNDAAVCELVDALRRIESYQPEQVELSEDEERGLSECPDCAQCQQKKWPPSGMCSEHYDVIARRDRANTDRYNAQHITMKEIARAALRRFATGGES